VTTTQHDPILGSLNEQQQQAVLTTEGPVLILAGAGSGKTKALTHRIARLIGMGVPPWQILAVTFTNKAAKEMKERVINMLHISEGESHETRVTSADEFSKLETRNSKLPVMGTFHSICVRILRRDIERLGRDRSFVIYDGDDQEKLMKATLKEMRIDEAELKPRAALSMISKFKSEALNPAQAYSGNQ
jgi:DNA helicase II / ATP-dependent DNA helicase PcrA